jgi:tetratricopeptide (TPR) repeat protein
MSRAREKVLADPAMNIAEALVELGVLELDKVRQAGSLLVQEEFFDLFLWDGAQFEFYVGNPPREIYDPKRKAETFSFDLKAFFEEAKARLVEVRKVKQLLSSERVVLSLTAAGTEKAHAGAGEPHAVRVLRLFDGDKRLDDILGAVKIGQYDVLRTLHALLGSGDLRTVRVESERRDLEADIAALEEALDRAILKLAIHVKLGRAYEDAGENEKAGASYKKASITLLENDRDAEAVDLLTRAATIAPNDFEAQERLTYTLFRTGKNLEAAGWGMKLGEKYRSLGLLRRALGVFQTLLGKDPDNLHAHRLIVDTHLALGETSLAVEEGLSLAKKLEKKDLITEVYAIYKNLIKAGADPALFQQRVKEMHALRAGIARRVVLPVAAGAAFLVAATLMGLELSARVRARPAFAEAARLTQRGDFAGAAGTLRARLGGLPYHPLAWREGDALHALDAADAYVRFVTRFEEALDAEISGRPEEAVAALHEIESAAPSGEWKGAIAARVDACTRDAAARNLAQYAQGRILARDYEGARNAVLAIAQRYPGAWAEGLSAPILVESSPSGAELLVDGLPHGRTPVSISYSPAKAHKLELKLAGYRPENGLLTAVEPPALMFKLRAGQ